MEKLLSVDRTFEKLEQKWFPLARKSVSTRLSKGIKKKSKKSFHRQEYLKIEKNWFPLKK